MKLLARTHRPGRLAHGMTGEQAGVGPVVMGEAPVGWKPSRLLSTDVGTKY